MQTTLFELNQFHAHYKDFCAEGFSPRDAESHAAFTMIHDELQPNYNVRIIDVQVYAYNVEVNWEAV